MKRLTIKEMKSQLNKIKRETKHLRKMFFSDQLIPGGEIVLIRYKKESNNIDYAHVRFGGFTIKATCNLD